MLDDFLPVIHKMPMSEHPNRMTIVPLSDVHYGSKEFNETLWHTVIKRIQDDPDCFCVLVGDMMDNGLKNSATNVYEATCGPREQKEWLINELTPIKDKILGAVGGNHERRTVREVDQDPLYDVLLALGKENLYRPNICFMQLKLTHLVKGKVMQRVDYSFAITHGAGGGQYIGSSANRVQNFGMAIEGIDCLITGHTHKPVSFPVPKLELTNGVVLRKQFYVAVAGSFLNYGGYPVRKLLPPTAHTMTEIVLTYTTKKKELRVVQ